MKKQTKKSTLDKVTKQWKEEAENLINGFSSTNDLYKVNQSVNQKVERSEEDVKERFDQVVTPLTVLVVINILLSFVNLVR
jgi:hypothetical protein